MKRWLSLLLVLAMIAVTTPLGAISAVAEDVEIDATPETEAAPADWAGDTGLVVEEWDEVIPETADADTEAVPEAESPTGETTGAAYARVTGDGAEVCLSDQGASPFAKLPADSVVIVTDGSGEWSRIAFAGARGVAEGWTLKSGLEPLEGIALETCMDAMAASERVALYQDDLDKPLEIIDCAYIDTDLADEAIEDSESGESEADAEDAESDAEDEARQAEEPGANAEDAEIGEPATEDEVSEAEPESEMLNEEEAKEPEAFGEEGESEAIAKAATLKAGAAPTDMTLSASTLILGAKERHAALAASFAPAGASAEITWSSSKPKVAAVDAATGEITAKRTGSAIITATTANGISRECAITVMKAPRKIKLNEKAVTLAEGGQTFQLEAELTKKSASTLTYESSNANVAAVDAGGVIRAVHPGTATITVSTFNKKRAKCEVKVIAAPDQVFLPRTLVIGEAMHATVEASVVGANNAESASSYVFSAQNGTGAVTIDAATGEIVGVRAGTATVRVRTYNGVSTHLSGGARVETVCAVTVVEAPVEIRLAAYDVTIGVKQSFALKPVMISGSGQEMSGVDYEVTSNGKKKLTVTPDGVVTGVKKGDFQVKVQAYNGVSAICTVHVVKAPSKVLLSPAAPVIGVGQTSQLAVEFPKGGIADYTFETSDPSIVAVDAAGRITGLRQGSAVVTVRTTNRKTGKANVTVSKAPSYLALNAEYELKFDPFTNNYNTLYKKTLLPGDTFQLSCENEYMTYGDVVGFESLNPPVAKVSATGLITAVKPGAAIIVVRSTGGAETRLYVTVSDEKVVSLSFVAEDVTVRAGQTVPAPALKGKNLTDTDLAGAKYASGNSGIFTVEWDEIDREWKLHGVKAGTAALTATARGVTARVDVTVTSAQTPSSQIHFESGVVYLAVGETWKPAVYDEYDAAVDAALTSTQPEIATVDENGAVTGVAEGDAVITATSGAMTANVRVGVREKSAIIKLNADKVSLAAGQRFALAAQVNSDGVAANLTFKSSDTGVATVSASGTIIGHAPGVATVTVSTYGGTTASCKVTVLPAPSKVSIEPASITERLGDKGVQLVWAFGASDEMGDVSFSSDNPAVATVSAKGYVSLVGVGVANVSVQTFNGLTASIEVKVLPQRAQSTTPRYRLFAAYEYFNSSYRGYLPFPKNNADSVARVFERSSVSGLGYSTKVMGNPSKTQLLSGISRFFADSSDKDVSIVYLCSHGVMTSGYGGYRMTLPGYEDNPENPNYYVSAQDLFRCVSRIQGSVVLIIDSCYSGSFLQDMKGSLDAMGGRIAVLTAASDTRATYYKDKKVEKAVDFFTFFLLAGLGYNSQKHWWNRNAAGKSGSFPGYLAADVAGNGDGIVTLGEFFSFASNSIATNIPKYMKKSWYWGDRERVQAPRYYAGNLNDLVIYQPKG